MVSTAADFLALAALKRAKVDVNGQTIHVRELSVKERAKFLELFDRSPALAPAWLVQTCAISPDGKPLFTEKDTEALSESAPAVVDKVAAAVMKASNLEGDGPNA